MSIVGDFEAGISIKDIAKNNKLKVIEVRQILIDSGVMMVKHPIGQALEKIEAGEVSKEYIDEVLISIISQAPKVMNTVTAKDVIAALKLLSERQNVVVPAARFTFSVKLEEPRMKVIEAEATVKE